MAALWSCLLLGFGIPPVLLWVLSKYSDFLPHDKNMLFRFMTESKFLIGANVSINCS